MEANTFLYNLTNSKKNIVLNKNTEINKLMKYIGGDSILYKNIYVQNQNNSDYFSRIYMNDNSLTLEAENIVFSGNVNISGLQMSISGPLDMSCNNIIGVSGLIFCDDTYIGNSTTYSFDILTDKTLTLESGTGKDIVTKNRIHQELNAGASYNNVNGYYALAKNCYPALSRAYANKLVSEWNTRTTNNNQWRSVTWSPELGLFVAVAGNGNGNRIMTSPDGINWTLRNTGISLFNCNNGIGNVITCNSTAGLTIGMSIDILSGSGSVLVNTTISDIIDSMTFTTNNIVTGLSNTTLVSDNIWRAICWSPELSLFVAVSISGTKNRVMTSPDGINWTLRNTPVDNDWRAVCWSRELNLFVAVAITGINNRVMTSSNGIDWIIRNTPSNNNWFDICWSPELGLFVAVASSDLSIGDSVRIMTSSNGIDWIIANTPIDNNLTSVCWSSKLGIFVAVASSGTGNRVVTSSNGLDWVIRNTPVDNQWYSVKWSSELNLFVAVSRTGNSDRIMISFNGVNWNTINLPLNNDWLSLCWSPELSLFVAVSWTGSGNRLMTSSLKGRIPTSYNTFDSPFNSIDSTGNWTIQQVLKSSTYTSGTTGPNIAGSNLLYITNNSATTITSLTGGTLFQPLTLVFNDANTTLSGTGPNNIRLSGGASYISTTNSTLSLLNISGNIWIETGRSIN